MSADHSADRQRRLLNLWFAFQSQHSQSSRRRLPPEPLTTRWIRDSVVGYMDDPATDSEVFRKIEADVELLQTIGVSIEAYKNGRTWQYVLRNSDTERSRVKLTAEEATILSLIVGESPGSELGGFAHSAWIKLAAYGAHPRVPERTVTHIASQDEQVPAPVFEALTLAISRRRRVEFSYQVSPISLVQRRRMDPWTILPFNGRAYLVGWDIDKSAPRVFRLSNIKDAHMTAQPSEHPVGDHEPEELVRTLTQGSRPIKLVCRWHGAGEPTGGASLRDDGLWEIAGVDEREGLQLAARLAPDLVVIEPPDIREQIIANMEGLLADAPHSTSQGTAPVQGVHDTEETMK